MEKECVPYLLALRMKALDYDEPCMASRDMGNNNGLIQVPTWQQAFRWFREEHKFYCYPEPTGSWKYTCKYRGEDKKGKHWSGFLKDISDNILFFNSFEEAELECLIKLIEIVESKTD